MNDGWLTGRGSEQVAARINDTMTHFCQSSLFAQRRARLCHAEPACSLRREATSLSAGFSACGFVDEAIMPRLHNGMSGKALPAPRSDNPCKVKFLLGWGLLVTFIAGMAYAGPPPSHLPRIITGEILSGVPTTAPSTQPSMVFGYSAVWSDADDGYTFTAPGRPIGWELITVDVDGIASIGSATADWAYTPIGRSLDEAGYSFVPQTLDFGVGWDIQATGTPLFWGMVAGLLWDMMVFIYAGTIGKMGRVFGNFHN